MKPSWEGSNQNEETEMEHSGKEPMAYGCLLAF